MDNVLTLVVPARGPALADLLPAVREGLERAGAALGGHRILAPDAALDLFFSAVPPETAEAVVRAIANGEPVDLLAQPQTNRRKRLLVADMDSTIVMVETLDELAAHAGLKDKIEAITERAMRGEIDFRAALEERVAMLADLPEQALADTFANAVELTPGAISLVRTMRANGAHAMLVSGGFSFFTEKVRRWVGFDEARANDLEIADGRLTGRIREPIVNREGKRDALIDLCTRHRVELSQSLAVGDGANDLPMLEAAGLGVAFHAKPVVAAGARARVGHGDLTVLLYYQGYRADEFVS